MLHACVERFDVTFLGKKNLGTKQGLSVIKSRYNKLTKRAPKISKSLNSYVEEREGWRERRKRTTIL